jgi:hypothetical protein
MALPAPAASTTLIAASLRPAEWQFVSGCDLISPKSPFDLAFGVSARALQAGGWLLVR